MKILHLDSSILGEYSFSRSISAQVMEQLNAAYPDAEVTYRDLAADPLPHISGELMGAIQGMIPDPRPEIKEEMALADALIDEFLSADIVVIGVALYNLTVSTQLKTWLDRVLRAGKTFRYNEQGVREGLVGDTRVILCISRGGDYSVGSPGAEIEHCESLLRHIFHFIGVERLDVITADGGAMGPELLAKAQAHVAQQLEAFEA